MGCGRVAHFERIHQIVQVEDKRHTKSTGPGPGEGEAEAEAEADGGWMGDGWMGPGIKLKTRMKWGVQVTSFLSKGQKTFRDAFLNSSSSLPLHHPSCLALSCFCYFSFFYFICLLTITSP
jgi:hypothetical protein